MANLVIALCASLALNGFLGLSWWKSHDALVAEKTRTEEAQADANGCSEAVEVLHANAAKRAAEAAKPRAAAATKAQTHEQRADFTLSLKPKSQNDACASMQAMGDEWLQGRIVK